MKLERMHWIGIVAAIVVLVGGAIFFFGDRIFYFMIVISIIVGALPFMISFAISRGEQKEKETRFLEFTRDLVGNVKSGTPISRSVLNLKGRNYGPLTPHVQKLANQISLGIPFSKALRTFAKDSKSKVISRAVNLISEAERAGGHIDTVLESVSGSVNQVEKLRKERMSSVSNLVVQGYIIFLVFIVIMLVLEFQILPMTAGLAEVDSLDISVQQVNPEEFAMPLFVMILVQSAFAGLVIGKVSEGSIKDGIKHAFILLAITLLIKTGASVFIGG